jgi:hypothetical protein
MEFPSWAEYERLIYSLPETYPQIASSTFSHHYHEPPNIKHNRKPAAGISPSTELRTSFQAPNLPTLIADCIALGDSMITGPSASD